MTMRFFLPYLSSKNESTFCEARARDLISDAAGLTRGMNENEYITLLLVVALCVRGRRIRNASIEISLNFDEKKIFRSRAAERGKNLRFSI